MGLFEITGIGEVGGWMLAMRAQLNRIEDRLDLLLEHLAVELAVEYVPGGVVSLLEAGQWQQAVKGRLPPAGGRPLSARVS